MTTRIGQPFAATQRVYGAADDPDALDAIEAALAEEWPNIVRAHGGVALTDRPDTVQRVVNLHYGQPLYDGAGMPVLDPAGNPMTDRVRLTLYARGYAIRSV